MIRGPVTALVIIVAVAMAAVATVVVVHVAAPRPPDPFTSDEVATLPATVEVSDDGVPTVGGAVLPSLEWQPGRRRVDLAGPWRSQRVAADHGLSLTDRAEALPRIERAAGGRQRPGYNDRDWARHDVPSPENEMRGDAPPEEYEGGVWYRRTVQVPAPADGERVRMVFEAVSSVADVWVDGRWLGYHEGGYSPFVVDVSEAVRAGGEVTIAVRVDNPDLGGRTDTVPAQVVDWMNYTGIIGGVHLEYVPDRGIARVDAVPRALDGVDPPARIGLDVTVVVESGADSDSGPVDVALRLAHADVGPDLLTTRQPADLAGSEQEIRETGRSVERGDGRTVVRVAVEIERPRLWSPQEPALHVLTAGIPGDSYATQVGLRTVAVAADTPQVLLNGRAARFTGLNRHQEWRDSGRTVTDPDRVAADLLAVRDTGATLLRTAHYPNDPLTYLIADRIGLAVIEEIPMWWADAYAFADQDRRRIADQMWREMIFRDRNRASVIAWSAANEGRAPDARAAYLNRLVRDLRLHYPDGRLVTQSAAADRPGPDDPSRDQVDVAGFTLYPGTFDDATPAAVTRRAADFLHAAAAADPRQPIWVTEFGAFAGPDETNATRQAELFDAVWAALSAQQHLAGAAWWAFDDSFTPIAGVNTFGLQRGSSGEDRPVAARLRSAYRAAPPPTSGPQLAARAPLVPDLLPPPDRDPAAPGVLSDFAAPDAAEPAGDTRVQVRDEALVLAPTGSSPAASVYLYGRPVDTSTSTRLCLSVLDPDGGARLRMSLTDTGGASTDVAATGRTEPGSSTTLCAPLRDGGDADRSRIERVTVTLDRVTAEELTIDDLVLT